MLSSNSIAIRKENGSSKKKVFTYILLSISVLFFLPIYSQNTNPSLSWGTYWGGGEYYSKSKQGEDNGSPQKYHKRLERTAFSLTSSCTDAEGNLYVVGKQRASLFPLIHTNPLYCVQDRSSANADAYIAKFSPQGELLWSHYYGSSAHDEACVVKADKSGNIYVAGRIYLSPRIWDYVDMRNGLVGKDTILPFHNDFPIQERGQSVLGQKDTGALFILKFTKDGERLWAKLYGPEQNNISPHTLLITPNLIEIDTDDNVYICGTIDSRQYNLSRRSYTKGKTLPVFGPSNYYLHSGDGTSSYLNAKEHEYFRQFIFKLNASDSLVWSTYFPAIDEISSMKTDSKNNLYIYGLTSYADFPPTKQKERAYFAKKREMDTMIETRFPYLAKIDAKGKYQWCTHLGSMDMSSTFTADMLITEEDHVILTGSLETVFLDTIVDFLFDFPLVEQIDAYNHKFWFTGQDYSYYWRTFFTEFDSQGEIIWSTAYPYKERHNMGFSLHTDKKGGFYCLGASTIDYERDRDLALMSKQVFLCHFDFQRKLIFDTLLPIILPPYTWVDREHHYDMLYNDSFRPPGSIDYCLLMTNSMIANVLPTLNLSLSPTGTLYLTTNTLSSDSTFLKTASPTSYQQSKPLLPSESLSGLILSFSLCDTNFYSPIPLSLRDTLICKDDPFSLTLTLRPPNANFRQRIWNKGMPNEYIGDSCPVTTFGSYYAEIQSIYTQCPSIYSDTLHIDTLPAPHLDFSFPSDTLSFCVGTSTHTLHATNIGASYLWQDGSTDSTYTIRYQGDSLQMLWCQVSTPCGHLASDTLWARFYPPYAYLGEDTLLCHQDSLPLDASLLNANLPGTLSYLWIFNGDTLPGKGSNGALYTLHYPDSGSLILQVRWADFLSQCNIALDTLHFSYYRGADIHFSIQDTTICAGTTAHLQIQTQNDSPDALYTWYNAEGTQVQEGKYFSTQDSGTYTIIGSNPCSRQETEVKLRFPSQAWTALNIPTDTLFCPQEELCLDVRIHDHPTIYQWTDRPDYTFGYRCFTQSGDYELSLIDTVGCSATYTLHIQSDECTPILEMPNVFTPNGDGINDLFSIKTSEKIYDFEILIYNNWGLKVYDYKGLPENFQWTGIHKSSSRPVPDGNYFYITLFKDYQGKSKKQSGCIAILR